ncbi:uncharacterized protein STAUR_1030 [Stigmatella aurantiaca DW4/3-1]|uniref:Lipoprotein n=1 Tax=Stigmatella aurantiaca (strain DW4/3-1) TaxID=378806 RepID=E3FDF5_STIAD|nr:uncharacterized protein STAUR_1030 [Stigmatella aurantiaca DW4/3-1]
MDRCPKQPRCGDTWLRAVAFQAILLMGAGCFHAHKKPRIASEQVAATIQFPEWSQDKTTTVTGPQLRALQIAMDDFRPLGSEPLKKENAWTQCLLKLETYDARVGGVRE